MANEIFKNTEAINETATTEKEDATMANEKNINTEAIETTEAPAEKFPKFSDVITPADEDREMLLITATRNKNDAMYWEIITVPAGADPKAVIKTVTDKKFVNLVDMRNVKRFIEAGTVLRGMASTVSDFTNRYAKTMGVEVTDKVATVHTEFNSILLSALEGVKAGSWLNPETVAKQAAEDSVVNEAPAEEEVDPYDVADAE